MKTYPLYYKQGCKCIKREGDTYGMQVEIPEPCRSVTLIHSHVTMPDKARFDRLVKDMELVSEDVYLQYVKIFTEVKRKQTRTLSSLRIKDLNLHLVRDIRPAQL